ncbi:MAG: hypothetical protein NTU63_00985 [Candidatus Pacearchaeota archaeon]|nr:hypothetical protein [Candidatus Pacearchaeota archaeon]
MVSMGRTRIAKAAIVELKEKVRKEERLRKGYSDYLKTLKENYSQGKISYATYVETLYKKRDGRNIPEWIDYLDKYDRDYKKEIGKQEKAITKKKIVVTIFSLALIGLLFFSLSNFSNLQVNFTGFAIKGQGQEVSQKLNLEFTSSENYELEIKEVGKLSYAKLSGSVEGTGNVKVYLDDLLIYEYSGEKNEEEVLQKNESSPSQEEPLPPSEFKNECEETCNLDELNLNKVSYTLKIEISDEAKLSLDEIRYKIIKEVEETVLETTQEENVTTPKTISEEETIPKTIPEENITTPESSITVPENVTIQKNITEEANVTETNITIPKSNITVPENATTPETTPKEETIPVTPKNITVPQTNITVPENVTIEENITQRVNATGITVQKNLTEIINITTEENITEGNATVSTIQYPAVLGQPVKWKKEITPESLGNITIKLPKEAKNVVVNEIEYETKARITPSITGGVISSGSEKGFLVRFFEFLARFFENLIGRITGRAIDNSNQQENSQSQEISVEVEADNSQAKYEIEYETPAPQSFEEETSTGRKQITISGPDSVHYQNVLAFTQLTEEIKESFKEKIRLYRTTDGTRELVEITNYIDSNNNGLIDSVEWNVPSLSNQTYELIIEISKAEHLNSNKEFISDIYNEVSALDDVWSETISSNDYVRVTFNQPLDSTRDITIYPRVVSGNPRIEVYEKDKAELIAEFTNLTSNEYNKVYLTNLQGSQDTFDLQVLDGSVEFDYIVDPIGTGIDGSASAASAANNGSSLTASLTTTQANDVIIVFAGGSNASQTVTSITDTQGLDWIPRKAVQYTDATNSKIYIEEWYAVASSALTADVINVTWSGMNTHVFVAFGIMGANTTAIFFDANPSLPSNDSSTESSSSVSTILNTTNANDIIIAATIAARYSSTTCRTFTVGPGFTRIATQAGAAVEHCTSMDTIYQNVSTIKTNLNVSEGGSGTTTNNFIILADAIMALPVYPQFSGYLDNNASLTDTGTGNFSVNVTDTNSSVYLSINGVNVTAKNQTAVSATKTTNIYNFATCTPDTNCWAEDWDVDIFPFSNANSNKNTDINGLATNYSNASALDNQNWTTQNPSTGDEIVFFTNWTISERVAKITEINFTFCGAIANSTATNFGIYVLNKNGSWGNNTNWNQVGANQSIGWARVCFSRLLTSGFTNYINGNNRIVWMVTEAISSSNMRIDYIEMNITSAVDFISYGGATFNATYDFSTAGTYPYTWISYGIGSDVINISNTRSYTVNGTVGDTTKPNINITYPTNNNTNWSINNLTINYTVTDANLQACWWSNDSMVSNMSLGTAELVII